MDAFVELKQHAPFAKGGNRACYVDPRDSGRCIKVILPERSPRAKRRAAKGLKKLRPLYYYDDNLRELQSYKRIEAFAGEDAWAHLPKCAGLVQTDCGKAIVTELILDHDGAISVDAKAYLRACGNDQVFRAAVEEFCLYLEKVAVPTRDILLHNLVARRIHADGSVRLYLIDGFGTSDLIPFVYWLRPLAKSKAMRKIVRFKAKIEDFLQKYDIPFYE